MSMTTMNGSQSAYIPDRQDIIWIDFDPSLGKEIRKRRPAVVLSSKKYSKVSGLTIVAPITHASNNQLRQLFLPVQMKSIDGYVNTLQFYTLDYRKRNADMRYAFSVKDDKLRGWHHAAVEHTVTGFDTLLDSACPIILPLPLVTVESRTTE